MQSYRKKSLDKMLQLALALASLAMGGLTACWMCVAASDGGDLESSSEFLALSCFMLSEAQAAGKFMLSESRLRQ